MHSQSNGSDDNHDNNDKNNGYNNKKRSNNNINNDNNTATQVAIKAETISNRKQQKNEKNLLSIKYLQ